MTRTIQPLGYGRQSIDEDDRAAVLSVLDSNHLTQGIEVDRFEQGLADYVGAKYAVAVSSGTAALHIACLAAGLKNNDLAVTSTLTFVATANAPIYCGAKTSLLDIDPLDLSLSLEGLSIFLEDNPETKAILPIHFAGLAGNMARLRSITKDRIVIEDASHALGGENFDGSKVGSCTHSDMCVFSFHPVKPITTAEGGAVTTNDPKLAHTLAMLRNHGIERDPDLFDNTPPEQRGPWSYEQQQLGFNYRLSDLQAALGVTQLSKLDHFLDRRRKISAHYDEQFSGAEYFQPIQSSAEFRSRSGHHLFVLQIDFEALNKSRKQVMLNLREKGIGTQVHYIPVHKQPYHQGLEDRSISDFHHAEQYYSQALSIPFYPSMTDSDVDRVIGEIRSELA